MRALVADANWPVGGGGESYALGIAHALRRWYTVELLAPTGVDWDLLADHLRYDVAGFEVVEVDFLDGGAVADAGRHYDLFVNTSYATDLANPAPDGLLVVHFPTPINRDLGPLGRAALRVGLQVARSRPPRVRFVRGFHPTDGRGPPLRWTTHDAELEVAVAPGRREAVQLVFGHDRPDAVEVEVETDDEVRRVSVDPSMPRHFVDLEVQGGAAGTAAIRIRCDPFFPLVDDSRAFGVPLLRWRVGNSARAKAVERIGLARRRASVQFARTYPHVAVNSEFTRTWTRRWWGVESDVVPPPVVPRPLGHKERVILSVGRFFPPDRGHSKRQAEMVEAFRSVIAAGASGWQLHLVGACQSEDRPYLDAVRRAAEGLPVTLHVDAPGGELDSLYSRASIYWHATGLGAERGRPEDQEHFGIAPVEAMSAGAVPVVYRGGGPARTVGHGEEGFHFSTVDELVSHTRTLVDNDALRKAMSARARARALDYSLDAAAATLGRILGHPDRV